MADQSARLFLAIRTGDLEPLERLPTTPDSPPPRSAAATPLDRLSAGLRRGHFDVARNAGTRRESVVTWLGSLGAPAT